MVELQNFVSYLKGIVCLHGSFIVLFSLQWEEDRYLYLDYL